MIDMDDGRLASPSCMRFTPEAQEDNLADVRMFRRTRDHVGVAFEAAQPCV